MLVSMSTTNRKARNNLLAHHHDYLERRLAVMVATAQAGDPVPLRKEWSRLEKELLRHLEFEETEILPEFARDNPAEADAIQAEHAEIRQALLDLGVKLDLHILRGEAVQAFAGRLAEHARHEEQVFYPWAERHVSRSRWEELAGALKQAGRRGGDRLLREFGRIM
jgi:hemerythrin-like domain-containing protein